MRRWRFLKAPDGTMTWRFWFCMGTVVVVSLSMISGLGLGLVSGLAVTGPLAFAGGLFAGFWENHAGC